MTDKLSCADCKYCYFSILGCYCCSKYDHNDIDFYVAKMCKSYKKKRGSKK